MNFRRGEIYIANLNPIKGSEQAGIRPVIVFQNEILSNFTKTVIIIPLTTNLRRSSLPTTLLISEKEANLKTQSVALCHQIRSIDKSRLNKLIGNLSSENLFELDLIVQFTLGYVS